LVSTFAQFFPCRLNPILNGGERNKKHDDLSRDARTPIRVCSKKMVAFFETYGILNAEYADDCAKLSSIIE